MKKLSIILLSAVSLHAMQDDSQNAMRLHVLQVLVKAQNTENRELIKGLSESNINQLEKEPITHIKKLIISYWQEQENDIDNVKSDFTTRAILTRFTNYLNNKTTTDSEKTTIKNLETNITSDLKTLEQIEQGSAIGYQQFAKLAQQFTEQQSHS